MEPTTESTDPADRTVFVLDEAAWDEFTAMLDREPQPNPKLRALFAMPSRIWRDRG